MGKLHLFELRSGHILLDGVTIRGIRECEFSIKENDSLAELSLKMDVRTIICACQLEFMCISPSINIWHGGACIQKYR